MSFAVLPHLCNTNYTNMRLNRCYLFFSFLFFYGVSFSNPVIEKYHLKYSFDFGKRKLFCTATIDLKPGNQGDTLHLLLYRLLKVKTITGESGNAIAFNQVVTSFSDWEQLQVNHISIPIVTASLKKMIIMYEGYLAGYTETGMSYVKDNISPQFTILRMDSYAYPIQGIPTWEKETTVPDFDYTVSVTVPDSLTVINGGRLISKQNTAGTTEYIYQNIKPAWRIDIAISKYATLTSKEFSIHYFPQDSTGAKSVAEYLGKAYVLYTDWFGKPASTGYSIIEIPDGWGSQTDVTCIIQTASAFKDENRLYELYHEISHLWNIPSTDANPCRLESEGLAVFLQYLVMEKLQHKPGWLDASAENTFQRIKKRFATDTVAASTPIIEYGKKQFTTLSYSKGFLFFYLLYKQAGEAAFMKTIKDYYTSFRGKGASTEEFSRFLLSRLNSASTESLITAWIKTARSSEHIAKSNSVKELLEIR